MGCLVMVEPVAALSLRERVERYLAKHGMAPSRFGFLATNNPNLVWRIREGARFHDKTLKRIEAQLLLHPVPLTLGQYKASQYQKAVQENQRIEMAEKLRRLTDPLEQAATLLRSRGWMVCRAHVVGAGDGWKVGTVLVGDEELLERARRAGWRG